ncbi:MAG TPA: hypothetical protein VLY63_30950 [Anaerolineae bacterium]|nr:hypothetical protein [Anaerolineae bacterium]
MQGSSQKGAHKPRRLTLALLAVGCAFLVAALVIGIGDNPPGLVLAYLAVSAWIVAFAHRWRKVKSFLILLAASLVGFPLSVVLHNVFYALAEVASDVVGLSQAMGFLEVVFFLIAVLVCPPGVLIGAVGSVVLALSRFRRERISDELP